ncbi:MULTISPECIES: DUF6942 family protein [Colwellia]|uniref:Uncharacterized protein n=1 Tax=Colwellia marinimaniae TaxID=1513592 RepID=A0ABQ0MX50_9GAMM|nr:MULTISPECIES: hypothetical protein [Colwellia]GAW96951.1 hypothetical protein MTCD1_02574 [Colwellia marinimaniae]
MTNIGFGDSGFNFAVYIANKPNMFEYQSLTAVMPLVNGEISAINQSCGNGWRKVFNVYAKVLYSLDKKYFGFSKHAPTWQDYRDKALLQAQSNTALLFSAPQFEPSKGIVHIICGKGHAKALLSNGKLNVNLVWLDDEFAIDSSNKLIVCPYFDYRQLSNIKIERLANLLKSLKKV